MLEYSWTWHAHEAAGGVWPSKLLAQEQKLKVFEQTISETEKWKLGEIAQKQQKRKSCSMRR